MAAPTLKYAIGNSASTTLSVAASNSDTTATITSDTNFAAKSGAGMVLIDESQATEELAYSTGKTGAVLALPLANRGLEGGSSQGHAINATVKGILTAGMWNDMIDSLANVLVASTGVLDTTKVVDLTTAQTLTAKTLTSPVINTGVSGTAIVDEDAMTSNSATKVPTQQSVKAYVDSGTVTMTNKRVTRRVASTTDDATAVIDIDTTDDYILTAIANNTEFTVTGTPTSGQILHIYFKDAGVSKSLTWTGITAIGCTLPPATTASKWHYVGCKYNSAASAWHALAVTEEA